ncbi:MAG: DnaJ C-terminal domain-containing protein [Myxococcota bacterium]
MAERPDYYAVLGVPRDATELAIRAAYRRLVLTHHPDRHPDDPDATLRLRNLVQAYEVLGDEGARSAYDAGAVDSPLIQPVGPLEEVLGRVVDAFVERRDARAESGRDHQYRLTLTLEQAARGCAQALELPKTIECIRCEGRGFPLEVFPKVCQACQGGGAIEHRRQLRRVLENCAVCDGQGYVVTTPCSLCDGARVVEERRFVTIDVPPGVKSGSKLVVKGAGQPGRKGGAPGDCFVVVTVSEHAVLRISGQDVRMKRPVSVLQSLTGGWLTVPTLDGVRRLKLPKNTRDKSVLRMAGLGLGGEGEGRGDQLVTIEVEYPVSLDDAMLASLKAMDTHGGTEVFPKTSRFNENYPKAHGEAPCPEEDSNT